MKNTRLDIIFLAVAIVLTVIVTSFWKLNAYKNTNKRLASNIEALCSEIQTFQTKDGKNAAQVKTLTLTVSELKKQNSQLIEEIKTLNIKKRDVNAVQQLGTQANYTFSVVRDSVVFDTIYKYSYFFSDEWLTFKALCNEQDSCTVEIQTRDSLLLVHHSRQRKFLWWTWHKYSDQVTVKNYNPHSTIQSVTSIILKK